VDNSLSITIGKAEALVLFDLLADFHDQPHLAIRNGAERAVLWMLGACLDKELFEPFRADYNDILEEARRAVLAKWG
jgi:hypothetical protein